MTDGFFMPQVVDHGVQIVDTCHGEGEGFPEVIWMSDLAQCKTCLEKSRFFVNRFGRTQCLACDEEMLKAACDHLAERQRKRAN